MSELIIKPHWQGVPHELAMDQLELFAAEVMPLLGVTEPTGL
jgi:hypothetical protein